jgi:outer membrane cobalamin receptor
MQKKLVLLSLLALILIQPAFAQKSASPEKEQYKVSGKVVDHSTNKPMEYATVVLLEPDTRDQVNGIATSVNGEFTISVKKPGKYILRVGFIGFKSIEKEVTLNQNTSHINIGEIRLHSKSENLGEVTVTANEHSIEYQIDKKVIHVSEQYTAISGNAVDILENVPSVQVDIEGNVSLRGNSNFTVLIDDRPTVLDANDALQQIPAGMIKDIEIITNPSAKYDPEGTAGIINIITKKRTLEGISGIAHLDVGLDHKYGADFLLNYRNEHFNVFVGGDYTDRKYPGFVEEENRTYGPDTTFYLNSDGTRERGRKGYSARAGIEWFPNEKNTLTISGRIGNRGHRGTSETTFEEYTEPGTGIDIYRSEESSERSGNYFALNSEYSREFSSKDHKLDAQLMFYKRDGGSESINKLLDNNEIITNGQKSTEGGPSEGLRYRLNYKQPFSDQVKIEAGAQGRWRDSEEWNEIYYYNTSTNKYELQTDFSNTSFYKRSIHAGYALMNGELNNFGYQLGFRAEYTYRDITIDESNENFNINRWDYFPTIHFSYQLPKNNQLMASYSRRIDRPRGWFLEPFLTWSDAYNVRRGNPDLQPEYINSYEMGYQKEFNKNSVSLEVYYRSTENRIERVRSVYENNIMLHTFDNVGTDYALGSELMINMNLYDWWETSLTGDFYNYRVKGELNGQTFDKESFTWSARWSHIFNITETTRLQLNPSYRSPEVEAQEREEGFFYMHGALRQSLLENKLNLTLQVRDIFATGKHESVTDADDFYNYRLYEHKAPMIMLNVTWRINNYRNGKRRNRGDGGMEMEGGGEMQ